ESCDSWATIHLGHTIARGLMQPTRGLIGGPPAPLLGLAPDGVYLAAPVARDAGGLLPHPFTLTCSPLARGHRRSALCCTCRRVTPPRRYLASCPMESGLSSAREMSRGRPANSHPV